MVIEQGFPATVGTPDRRMYDHCVCGCVRCVGMFVRCGWVGGWVRARVWVYVCVCVCEVCGVGWGGCECEVWGCEACVSVHTCMC